MNRITLDTSDSPEIIIDNVNGSLRIKGWDRHQFRGDADQDDEWDIKQDGNIINLSCTSGCLLRVPVNSNLKIGSVERELMVKSIEGDIEVDDVASQIIFKNVGKTKIQNAGNNLTAKHIEGDFKVDTVSGNAIIRDVDGDLVIEDNKGNLHIRGSATNMLANTKGNATLRLGPEAGGKYEISAKGNIHCKIAPGSSAGVILRSKAKSIRIKSPELKDTLQVDEYEFILGDGDSIITLEARGRVDFIAYPDDDLFGDEFEYEFEENITKLADEITHQVTEQIELQMDSLSSHLNDLTTGLSVGLTERSQRNLEAKRRKLDQKLSRAQSKAERKIRAAAAKRRAYERRYSRKGTIAPVTDQERTMILEMLQNQQISVAEAETLLAALEGRKPEIPTPTEAPQPPEPPKTVE